MARLQLGLEQIFHNNFNQIKAWQYNTAKKMQAIELFKSLKILENVGQNCPN
jgi:hypothetical protein